VGCSANGRRRRKRKKIEAEEEEGVVFGEVVFNFGNIRFFV